MWLYFVQFLTIVGLPLWLIAMLWRRADVDRIGWMLRASYSAAFIGYIFAVGRWDVVGVYGRYVIAALFLAAALVSGLHARQLPWFGRQDRNRWIQYATSIACLIGFTAFLLWALGGYIEPDDASEVHLDFPLGDGWFYVGQGGAATIVNHHYRFPAQRYALDVLQLNRLGLRARGLYPHDLDRYVIFEQPVLSPCDGEVISAVDELPDLQPPQSDREHVAGNHVVIACKGVEVLLAHLQRGSLQVERGMVVQSGTPVARVGNSGNTSEPHLHVHAVQAGSGGIMRGTAVPIRFQGRFLARNATLRSPRTHN
jgi:hypothetical protein